MEKVFPKRKNIRLKNFDYSSVGAYYITVCTDERKNLFWKNSKEIVYSPEEVILSAYGEVVLGAIVKINEIYPSVSVLCFVIMPNHVHIVLQFEKSESMPSLQRVISQFKGYVSKKCGGTVWQKLFYDHVIRDEADYLEIEKYIYENPMTWQLDKLYGAAF